MIWIETGAFIKQNIAQDPIKTPNCEELHFLKAQNEIHKLKLISSIYHQEMEKIEVALHSPIRKKRNDCPEPPGKASDFLPK